MEDTERESLLIRLDAQERRLSALEQKLQLKESTASSDPLSALSPSSRGAATLVVVMLCLIMGSLVGNMAYDTMTGGSGGRGWGDGEPFRGLDAAKGPARRDAGEGVVDPLGQGGEEQAGSQQKGEAAAAAGGKADTSASEVQAIQRPAFCDSFQFPAPNNFNEVAIETSPQSNKMLYEVTRSAVQCGGPAFVVPRCGGGGEMDAAVQLALKQDVMVCGGRGTDECANHLNGVFPPTREEIQNFAKQYVAGYTDANSGVGLIAKVGNPKEVKIVDVLGLTNTTYFFYTAMESAYFSCDMGYCEHDNPPWTAALENATVLVIHPFETTIRSQYERHLRGERIWNDTRILPRFTLKTLKTPISFAGAKSGTDFSFGRALEELKGQIDELMPFDVALLGCGSYGLPLLHYIYRRHSRSAVYIGGGLQIYFGIRGRRWMLPNQPLRKMLDRPYWVNPSPDETPPNPSGEVGTYWT